MTVGSRLKNDEFEGPSYTVSELNQAVAEMLHLEFGLIWLRGEVSGFTRAASGHFYLTLKDQGATVKAVMFRGRHAYCAVMPKVGDQVEVQARVGLYEPRGDFQLNIQILRPLGRGSLHEQFELLKAKLRAQGLFESAGKRSVLAMPRRIGVITSLGAAALHDVLTTLARRCPQVPVIIYPSLVQGQGAPLALRQALARANERQEVDTLLMVRGGGSMEDLWAFNDENLARDIAASAITIIVGVGHESDTTIADFVADVRAPTPTAAAEMSCVGQKVMLDQVAGLARGLSQQFERRLQLCAQRMDRLSARLVSPSQRIAARLNQVALLSQRLRHAGPDLQQARVRHQQASQQLRLAWQNRLTAWSRQLERLQAHLDRLSPTEPLERGFALVRGPQGEIIRDAKTLKPSDAVAIRFARGAVSARVEQVQPEPQTPMTKRN